MLQKFVEYLNLLKGLSKNVVLASQLLEIEAHEKYSSCLPSAIRYYSYI